MYALALFTCGFLSADTDASLKSYQSFESSFRHSLLSNRGIRHGRYKTTETRAIHLRSVVATAQAADVVHDAREVVQ